MRSILNTVLFVNSILFSFGQDYQKEINDQLWKPFIKASSEFDGEGFMALQSKDLIRIGLEAKMIHGYGPYEEGILPGFKRLRTEGKITRTTEIRFTDRIISKDLAYETGYFKSVTKWTDGRTRTTYTKFYFILRKEDGAWKILVDSDSSGEDVTDELFQAAKPLE